MIKLEVNNRNVHGKSSNIGKSNDTFLNNPCSMKKLKGNYKALEIIKMDI